MAERFQGPVTVTDADGKRQSVLQGTRLALGQTVSRGRRPGGFPGILVGPGAVLEEGGVFVDSSRATAVPDVSLDVGDRGGSGGITVRDEDDQAVINLNGANGFGTFGTAKGPAGGIMVRAGSNGPVILVTGKDGRITFFDRRVRSTLVIDGERGDIELIGADCAEDFELAEPAVKGSVMCMDEDGRVRPCRESYERRVVGVISGAGDWQPGLRLGCRSDEESSAPLALVGKVHCLADARRAPIGVGDLLTTSSTAGHAMRATDTAKSFGAILGKSLGSLRDSCGLVPVLVSLQ
jgi:hypothetical protein